MLRTILFDHSSEIFSSTFLEDSEGQSIVVCPKPSVADSFRTKIQDAPPHGGIDLEVITISKFISDELSIFNDDIKVLRKADLLLTLSFVWKRYFKEQSAEVFFQAFNAFTELRSFTLDIDLVREILNEYDPVISKAIEYFWHYTDQANLVDEHKSYFLLTDSIRSFHEEVPYKKRNIIFWGFHHISGGQVDLIKSLGIRDDVYLFFPKEVYASTQSSDWIRWFPLEGSFDKKNEDIKYDVEVIEFPKAKLAEQIKSFLKTKRSNAFDIFLATNRPTFNSLSEIPGEDYFFKAKTDLFLPLHSRVFESLEEHFFRERNEIESNEVVNHLLNLKEKELEKKFEDRNFRYLKILALALKTINDWMGLSELAKVTTSFDIALFRYVTELNLPRVFSIPLLTKMISAEIKDINSLHESNPDKETLIVFSSNYESLRGGENSYSEEMMLFLSTVGPVRRKELEYLLIKQQIIEVISKEKTTLLIEHGLREFDPAITDILEGLQVNNQLALVERVGKSAKDPLGEISRNFNYDKKIYRISATRMQSYIDCPRKYFFEYINKINLFPRTEINLLPNELGSLEHKIIEKYFQLNKDWEQEALESLSQQELDTYIAKEKIILRKSDYRKHLLEIINYSSNAIQNLLVFKNIDPNFKISFEVDLKTGSDLVSGSIDCIVKTKFGSILLDFKRSEFSIPTKNEILNFQKIQLPFYLKNASHIEEVYSIFGFFNLSDPKKSLLFSTDNELQEKLISLNFSDGAKIIDLAQEYQEVLNEYSDFQERTLISLNKETEYSPIPRKDAVCQFCVVKNVCPREII